jgi:hypothetical protein
LFSSAPQVPQAPQAQPQHHHPAVQDLFGVAEPQPIPQRRVSQANEAFDGGIGRIVHGMENSCLHIVVGESHELRLESLI